MKRAYVVLFVLVVAAALIGVAISRHAGYVLISYDAFRYESSIWAALALLVAVLFILWLLRMLIALLTTSGGVVNPWSRRNRSRRVQNAIEQGQMDLAEGRWASAQRNLHRAAEAERQPLCITSAQPVPQTSRAVTRTAITCLNVRWSVSPTPNLLSR